MYPCPALADFRIAVKPLYPGQNPRVNIPGNRVYTMVKINAGDACFGRKFKAYTRILPAIHRSSSLFKACPGIRNTRLCRCARLRVPGHFLFAVLDAGLAPAHPVWKPSQFFRYPVFVEQYPAHLSIFAKRPRPLATHLSGCLTVST